jgi:hypothetical protein
MCHKFGLSLIIIMNDGDQYFGEKINYFQTFFVMFTVGLPIHPSPEVVRRGRMGTCADSGTHLNFFLCRLSVFNVSERATKNPFLWYL